jgi:hypothetical protein
MFAVLRRSKSVRRLRFDYSRTSEPWPPLKETILASPRGI